MSSGKGPLEHAAGRRGDGLFPQEWGMALGRPYSDERAAWLRASIASDSTLRAHRRLADRDARLLVPRT